VALKGLRISHIILASIFVPIALAVVSLLINNFWLFLENLAVASLLCLLLIYFEARYMKAKGLI